MLDLALSLVMLSHPKPPLSFERIYASPALSGAVPRALRLTPDGERVLWLEGRTDDANLLDLWSMEVASGKRQRLVDATSLAGPAELSAAEQARRERLRIASLRGIVDFQIADDGQTLLIPIDGTVVLHELGGTQSLRLDLGAGEVYDPRLAPDGQRLAFVRDRELWLYSLADEQRQQLSPPAGDAISFAIAEFIAQEEMGRTRGYWWSPDSKRIAYTEVDERKVPMARRFEVYADRAEIIEQRYPATGTTNATVKLHVASVAGGEPWTVPLPAADGYLARVNWLPDTSGLLVQWQPRDQRELQLWHYPLGAGDEQEVAPRLLLAETDPRFVNLHDGLRVLDGGKAVLWLSERSGYAHLYRIDLKSLAATALTEGPWMVEDVLAVNEDSGWVVFAATLDSVLERHLYRVRLDGSSTSPERLSSEAGWHEAVFDDAGETYIHTWSNAEQPPRVSLRSVVDGVQQQIAANDPSDPAHPYHPWFASHLSAVYGELTTADGTRLHYRLIKPAGYDPKKRYPVLLRTYGGPHVQVVNRRWDERWGLVDQVFAQRGYLVYSLDNRGSSRRGKGFEDALFGRMGDVDVADQRRGIDELRARSDVDAQRIFVFGWSYGGYMTLHLLAQHSDVVAAGAAVAPVTDWMLYDTHYTERYMDHPQRNPDGYRQGNVLTHADQIAPGALLLIHGMADDNVLFLHSTALMERLQQRPAAFALMTYPGGKHALVGEAVRVHVFETIADYFDRHPGLAP